MKLKHKTIRQKQKYSDNNVRRKIEPSPFPRQAINNASKSISINNSEAKSSAHPRSHIAFPLERERAVRVGKFRVQLAHTASPTIIQHGINEYRRRYTQTQREHLPRRTRPAQAYNLDARNPRSPKWHPRRFMSLGAKRES